MSTEKEKNDGFFGAIRAAFLHEDEPAPSPDDRGSPEFVARPIPVRPPAAAPPSSLPDQDPDVVRMIDEQTLARLQAPVEAVAGSYAEFMASMDALAEAVPDLDLRQKAVIKLMTKKKIPLPKILNDLDACIGALEKEGRTFRDESESHVSKKVGGLKLEAESISASISAKAAQVSALEGEIAGLRAKKDAKDQEVLSAEKKAALVQSRFNIVYNSTHSAMTAQRKQVSDLIDKEQQ